MFDWLLKMYLMWYIFSRRVFFLIFIEKKKYKENKQKKLWRPINERFE